MFAKLRRVRLLAVAGCLTSAAAAAAADGAPPVVLTPPVTAPLVVESGVGCGGCDAPVGPTVGGVTGLGAAGTGIGLFAPNPPWWHKRQRIDGQNQPACAVNSHPLSDWAYIRKFCGPRIIPGTTYGHFQTKWRKWEDGTSYGLVGCAPGTVVADIPSVQPAPTYTPPPSPTPVVTPSTPLPTPQPMPQPMPKGEEPVKPKVGDASGQLLPIPLPDVPAPLPSLPVLPPQEARR